MRFGLIQEGHLRPGVDAAQRYAEMVEEGVPEILMGAIAARTERIFRRDAHHIPGSSRLRTGKLSNIPMRTISLATNGSTPR